jgi:hypothetical protein
MITVICPPRWPKYLANPWTVAPISLGIQLSGTIKKPIMNVTAMSDAYKLQIQDI